MWIVERAWYVGTPEERGDHVHLETEEEADALIRAMAPHQNLTCTKVEVIEGESHVL